MANVTPRKISLLTGAGFSKNIFEEMPSISELTQLVLDNPKINTSIRQAGIHPERFSQSKGLDNIETLLQVIEESAAYISDYVSILRRKELILVIEREIVDIISSRCLQIDFNSEQLKDFESLIRANINVLTTNYDLIFELATQHHIGTAFTNISYAYDLNAGLFDLGHQRKNLAYMSGDDSGKMLLSRNFKLHGSCDWYSFDTSNDDRMYIDTTKLKNFSLKGFEIETKENLRNMAPVIAPPTANKRRQIHSMALKSIWSSAYEALRGTEVLILFGTALHETDASLSALLIEGAPKDLRIIIFDWQPQRVADRVQNLLKNPRIDPFVEPSLSNLRKTIEGLKEEGL